MTEYGPGGQLLFDAHLPAHWESYRVYRESWSGRPSTRPAFALSRAGAKATVYASWNGATEVARWRVLGGSLGGFARAGRDRREGGLRDGDPPWIPRRRRAATSRSRRSTLAAPFSASSAARKG